MLAGLFGILHCKYAPHCKHTLFCDAASRRASTSLPLSSWGIEKAIRVLRTGTIPVRQSCTCRHGQEDGGGGVQVRNLLTCGVAKGHQLETFQRAIQRSHPICMRRAKLCGRERAREGDGEGGRREAGGGRGRGALQYGIDPPLLLSSSHLPLQPLSTLHPTPSCRLIRLPAAVTYSSWVI